MKGVLRKIPLTLFDIGCSGGIKASWRELNLTAVGFDPNIEEIERLTTSETNPQVRYEAAFVNVPHGHPLRREGGYLTRNPWQGLSVAKTLEIRAEKTRAGGNKALTEVNAWNETRLSGRTIHLPDYISEHGLCPDFVKIDIDGADFIVLQSLFEASVSPIGLHLEVNYIGGHEPWEHTFHNTDRFLRERGYDLYDLTVRRYSSSALPLRYEYGLPAQSIGGRPLQGDALYLRAPTDEERPKALAIFVVFGLYDQAATMTNDADILNGLTALVRPGMNYGDYMCAFERDDPIFYPS
jgi:hypothetical protein